MICAIKRAAFCERAQLQLLDLTYIHLPEDEHDKYHALISSAAEKRAGLFKSLENFTTGQKFENMARAFLRITVLISNIQPGFQE
jgi:hypothetical protein